MFINARWVQPAARNGLPIGVTRPTIVSIVTIWISLSIRLILGIKPDVVVAEFSKSINRHTIWDGRSRRNGHARWYGWARKYGDVWWDGRVSWSARCLKWNVIE